MNESNSAASEDKKTESPSCGEKSNSENCSGDVVDNVNNKSSDGSVIIQTKKKKKGKLSRKDRHKIKGRVALEKMRRFMIRKGLIDSDVSDGELKNIMNSDDSSDSGDSENEPQKKKKQKDTTRLKKRKRKQDTRSTSSSPGKNKSYLEVIVNSPSETTIY